MDFDYRERLRLAALEQDLAKEVKDLNKLARSASRTVHHFDDVSMWKKLSWIVKRTYLALRTLTDDRQLSYYYLSQEVQRFKGNLPEDVDINIEEVEIYVSRCLDDATRGDILYAVDYKDHFNAAKWLAEARLYYWLVGLNVKGVAPPAKEMFDKLASLWEMRSLGYRARTWLETINTEGRRRTKWLQEYRKRWLAVFMKMPARPPMTDADMRRKVGLNNL